MLSFKDTVLSQARSLGNLKILGATRGLVPFRTLIDNDARLAAIDAARRHASDEPH